jgi:predicted extracellular nuclease
LKHRNIAALAALALVAALVPATAFAAGPGITINEIRIDQPGEDLDEYFELTGEPGASLDSLTYLVIGDGTGGSGVIEAEVDLSGQSLDGDGFFVAAESTFTLGAADMTTTLNFENSDNVTHLLVDGFTGSNGDDLDTDDDGTLDVTPWSEIVDAVALVETPGSGDHTYSDVTVGPDGSFVPGHVFDCVDTGWEIGAFGGGEDTPGVANDCPDPDPDPQCDATEISLISQVQGDGATSPLAGDTVTVRAVVTLVAPSLNGFFIQEELGDFDADNATSEGLFVAGPAPEDAEAGSTVEATGGVAESFGRTQINAEEVAICEADSVEIDPTPLSLPADTAERETLEGMVVATEQDLFVSSLFTAYRFGELGVALDGPLTQPTSAFAPNDPGAQQLADDNAESLLFINDRDEFGDDNEPWFEDVLRRAGDVIEAGTVGALNFSFGDFLLEPLGEFPEIVQVEERPAAPRLEEGNDVGAFNVLNYFNTFGNSDVLRGAQNQAQFDLQSAKIVEAIVELDASVLGLIELENDYEDHYDDDPSTVPSIQTLVEQLNAEAGPGTYDWIVPDEGDLTAEGLGGGGLGPDAIAQGIIYQPARVSPVGDPTTFDIDAELTGEGTNKNRWPLAQSFEINGQVVTVVVNHFKSKGSSCADVGGPAFDVGDDVETFLTGNCNLTREYAAQRLMEWIETKPTGVNSPDTFVIGDLNSYEEEGPIELFIDAGYEDAVQSHGDDAFTFKFDGRYGRLDYVLASPSAKRLLEDAAVWQANSPEPYGYLYFNDPVDTPETATAYASSDHDPVIIAIDPPGQSGKNK